MVSDFIVTVCEIVRLYPCPDDENDTGVLFVGLSLVTDHELDKGSTDERASVCTGRTVAKGEVVPR